MKNGRNATNQARNALKITFQCQNSLVTPGVTKYFQVKVFSTQDFYFQQVFNFEVGKIWKNWVCERAMAASRVILGDLCKQR